MMRPLFVVAAVLGMSLGVLTAPLKIRALPDPVSVAVAKTYLAELTVAVDSNVPAYARSDFKTWDISECGSPKNLDLVDTWSPTVFLVSQSLAIVTHARVSTCWSRNGLPPPLT